MAFEVEIHFNRTLIPFKYIEFGFDKVKVQFPDVCDKHPCSFRFIQQLLQNKHGKVCDVQIKTKIHLGHFTYKKYTEILSQIIEKLILPCKKGAQYVSFEWSHTKVSTKDRC